MKRSFQYLGDSHTFVRLVPGAEKVKVGHGEIVESEMDPKIFLSNTFQEVSEGGSTSTPAKTPEKDTDDEETHIACLEDFTKAQLVAIAEKLGFELDGLTEADTKAKLMAKIEPQITQEVIEAEYVLINSEK